jgi:LacI family transcriptional regulator
MHEAGLEPDLRLVRFCQWHEDSAEREMAFLLDLKDGRPTAVISAGSNRVTHGCLSTLAGRGVRVPQDVSVIGFDNTPTMALLTPPLTVVTRPLDRIGVEAIRLLVDRLTGAAADREPTRVVLECDLLVRQSTAAPSAEHSSRAGPGSARRRTAAPRQETPAVTPT